MRFAGEAAQHIADRAKSAVTSTLRCLLSRLSNAAPPRGCKLAVDKYRQEHAIRAPMTKAWGKAKGQQNKGGSHASAAQAKVTSTPQAKAGYLFDAVWWIKE